MKNNYLKTSKVKITFEPLGHRLKVHKQEVPHQILRDTGICVLLVEQQLHFVRQEDRYYAVQRGGIFASENTSELSQAGIDKFLGV